MSVSSHNMFGDANMAHPALPGSYGEPPAGYRLPSATRLGAVRLQVSNLERSAAWYREVLGLVEQSRTEHVMAMGAPASAHSLVVLEQVPGTTAIRPGSRLGLYHFAILLPSRAALGQFIHHLASIGARAGSSDHLVSEAVYLQDPDGLGIEVYCDRPREQWQRIGRELRMASDRLDLAGLVAAAQGAPFTGFPNSTLMGHVHLHVGDLDRAARFYSEALGFDRMVWRYPGALFLGAGGYHHHLGTNTWAGGASAPSATEAKLIEWTIVLPTAANVTEALTSIESAGYRVHDDAALDDWGTRVRLVAEPGEAD